MRRAHARCWELVRAATTYPAGGSMFDGEGWTGSDASCAMTGGVRSVCSGAAAYDASGRSLATDVDVAVNLLGLFSGSAVWTSPAFAIPADADVTGATLMFDPPAGGGGGGSGLPVRRARCTIVGTRRADRLVGTRRRDVICGLGGNDTLVGLGGNDVLIGGPGRDVLRGGASRDLLRGGSGEDRRLGGAGRDVVRGTLRHDRVAGVELRRR